MNTSPVSLSQLDWLPAVVYKKTSKNGWTGKCCKSIRERPLQDEGLGADNNQQSCLVLPFLTSQRLESLPFIIGSVYPVLPWILFMGRMGIGPVINSIQFLFPNHFNSLINLLIVFGHEIHKTTRLLPLFLVINSTPSFRSRTSDSQMLNFNIVLFIYLKTKWIVKINLLWLNLRALFHILGFNFELAFNIITKWPREDVHHLCGSQPIRNIRSCPLNSQPDADVNERTTK